jgi:N-acetylglutamate synthase-like GNAT family acetyltransferase
MTDAGKGATMKDGQSPKATGISDLTGKVVRVRHANEADMVFIEDTMKKYGFDTGNLDYSEFVVAAENGKIVGFGRLKKIGSIYDVGCIVVIEGKKGRGIGQLIAKHLVDFETVERVYVAAERADYFRNMGFAEMKGRPKEYLDALDFVCKPGDKNKVLMSRERNAAKGK